MPPIYHFQLFSFYLSRDLSLTRYRYDKSEIKATILSYFFSLREEIEKEKKNSERARLEDLEATSTQYKNKTQKLNENYITVPVILSFKQEKKREKKSDKFENTLRCDVSSGLEEEEEEILLTWQQHLF